MCGLFIQTVRHPRDHEQIPLPEYVEVEAVLGLVGDGVPDPGEVLPVLPGHPLQGGGHVVQAGWPLLGTRGPVADGLEDPGPGGIGRGRGESGNNEDCSDVKLMVLYSLIVL